MLRSRARAIAVVATATLAGLTVASCSSSGSSGSSHKDTGSDAQSVTLLMSWLPQTEQGGYWDINPAGIAKKYNLKVKVQPGGPQVQTIPQVAAGQADFGLANADQILLARAQGVPIVGVMATFNKYPQCLMYHPESGIKNIEDVNGHTVAVTPGPNYWLWVKSHYKLDKVKQVNVSGSLAQYAQDKNFVQQCFMFQEPFQADEQHLSHAEFSVADLGYNPYGAVLFTTESMIKKNPDLVQAVVNASKDGWTQYMADPAAANEAIKSAGGQETAAEMGYSDKNMPAYIGSPVGAMTADRWQTLEQQMRDAGALTKDVDWKQAFTTQFLTP